MQREDHRSGGKQWIKIVPGAANREPPLSKNNTSTNFSSLLKITQTTQKIVEKNVFWTKVMPVEFKRETSCLDITLSHL